MVTALKPIELQTAAADDVPKVAAALADAFSNDPVYTWLLPGSLRLQTRLRAMFAAEMEQYVLRNGGAVWTTSSYDGAVGELPPGAWAMPKSFTGKEALRWMRAFGRRSLLAGRVQRAMEERHPPEPHFYVRVVGVRTALQGPGRRISAHAANAPKSRLGWTTDLHRGQQRAQRGTVPATRLRAPGCA